jgi:hypothetical protein
MEHRVPPRVQPIHSIPQPEGMFRANREDRLGSPRTPVWSLGRKRADACHVELDRARFRLAIGPSLLLLRPGSCGGGALSFGARRIRCHEKAASPGRR